MKSLQPHGNFFDILLVFFFLQTQYDIYFFHILSFYFFLFQINFCIYLLLALLIFIYHFHDNLLLYLVSIYLCFFDNNFSHWSFTQWNCIHSFLYIIKKIQHAPFFIQIIIIHYVYCIIFAHLPKVNSVITSFNGNNSNIIKINSFLHQIMTTIAKI